MGKLPLKKPYNPSLIHILFAQSTTPLYCLFTIWISPDADNWVEVALCCNLAFITCKGYVAVVATLFEATKLKDNKEIETKKNLHDGMIK